MLFVFCFLNGGWLSFGFFLGSQILRPVSSVACEQTKNKLKYQDATDVGIPVLGFLMLSLPFVIYFS